MNEHVAMLLDAGGLAEHWPDLVMGPLLAFGLWLLERAISRMEKRYERSENKFERQDQRIENHECRITVIEDRHKARRDAEP